MLHHKMFVSRECRVDQHIRVYCNYGTIFVQIVFLCNIQSKQYLRFIDS